VAGCDDALRLLEGISLTRARRRGVMTASGKSGEKGKSVDLSTAEQGRTATRARRGRDGEKDKLRFGRKWEEKKKKNKK